METNKVTKTIETVKRELYSSKIKTRGITLIALVVTKLVPTA